MALSKPKLRINDPYQLGVRKPQYCKLFYPSSVGVITAAVLSACPSVLGKEPAVLEVLPRTLLDNIPKPVLLALLGFPIGYLATKTANWIRWRTIQRLLAYQKWIHGGKGFKNKAWAMLLKVLKGPGPAETYDYQRSLPKLPLPKLDDTLDKWLFVAADLVSKEEFEQTKAAVEMFRNNEGPKLQKYLEQKYRDEVNWLSDYWMNVAYLASRDPICITSNYFMMNKTKVENINYIDRAAIGIRYTMDFYEMIEENRLPPAQLMDLVPLCMNGFRYIFNSIRVPGEHIDSLHRYPGETHIVILRNGNYYKMEMYTHDADNHQRRLLTTEEIKMQMYRICEEADSLDQELPVASLTSQNRTLWAKQRDRLLEKNSTMMKVIESSLFMAHLDDIPIEGKHEHCHRTMAGLGGDRWFDKPFYQIYYESGSFGANIEHSGIDATVIMSLCEYMMMIERYPDGKMPPGDAPDESITKPTHMSWDLEYMKEEINIANEGLLKQYENVQCHLFSPVYSKGVMKKARLSPDGYAQMALQLAYYNLHKETPKTYEPSTARMYALGRTENIYPVSAHSKAWVQSMLNTASTNQTRRDLLKKAVNTQNKSRLAATVGEGCERHLVGLYCASREFEMDVPALYLDKSWQLPFKLSTSQTPCRAVDLGSQMDHSWVVGGFGPQCPNGYGLSYVFHSDDLMNMIITCYKSSESTDAAKFADAIDEALVNMKAIFD